MLTLNTFPLRSPLTLYPQVHDCRAHRQPIWRQRDDEFWQVCYYAPGLVSRKVHFGSLKECVDAAVLGKREICLPSWLVSNPERIRYLVSQVLNDF